MTRSNQIALALVATTSGLLLPTVTAGAHAGEEHTASGLGSGDGLGLIVVALLAGGVWWLANRRDPAPRPDRPNRNDLLRPDVNLRHDSDGRQGHAPLVADRRLRPRRHSRPRHPSRMIP